MLAKLMLGRKITRGPRVSMYCCAGCSLQNSGGAVLTYPPAKGSPQQLAAANVATAKGFANIIY